MIYEIKLKFKRQFYFKYIVFKKMIVISEFNFNKNYFLKVYLTK